MRGQQDSVAGCSERPDDLPELASRLGVEPGGRLIEEEQLGAVDQRAGDREPLFLPAGQRADAGATLFLELHEREHLVHRVGAPVEAAEQRDRLRDRELVAELGVLELDAETLAQRAPPGPVVPTHRQHLDRSRVGKREPFEDLDGGSLAGAVGAEQAETLAGLDREVETGNRHDVAVALDQPCTLNRRHVRRRGEVPDPTGAGPSPPLPSPA